MTRAAPPRWVVLALGLAVMPSSATAADRQIRPFIGVAFAGSTTYVDPDQGPLERHATIGVSAFTLGEIFGVDVDLADTNGFFESGGQHLVLSSHVTTFTGNLVIAAPHRLTEYSLRPYFVAGGGVMRVRSLDYFGVFDVASVLPTFDFGGGAQGFLNKSLGVAWEVRRFGSVSRRAQQAGLTLNGDEQVSFWRASMALAIRY
jgi:hypothetical protein